MRRGFLKTQRCKHAVGKESTSPPTVVGEAARASDCGDVEMTPAENTRADGVGHVAHATDSESESKHECETSDAHDGEIGATSVSHPEPKKKKKKKKKKKGKEKVDANDHPMDDGAEARAMPPKSDDSDTKGNDDNIPWFDAHIMHTMPPRPPPPRRSGWGRRPEEEFFHTDPRSGDGPHKKRTAFCFWPRDPKGKLLVANESTLGKLSPDGYSWGETLYDFFYVNRVPGLDNYVTTVTGSKLLQVMEALGELDAAVDQILWAKSEGEPRIEGVADTEELISCVEWRVQFLGRSLGDKDKHNSEQGNSAMGESGVGCDGDELPADVPPPPTIPVTSPFHPSHYPEPWPLTPFEHSMTVLLQDRIPLHLLPQTLYVHDPFCLLSAVERQLSNTSWTSRPDIIRTYNLQLSESVRTQVEDTTRKAQELEEFKARTKISLRYRRTKEQIENFEPEIEVPLPTYVRRPTKIEESHLYISPVAKVGEGHHSLVYKAEWELPRNLFVKEKICPHCFQQSVDQEIQTMKDTGTWDKLVKASGWGPKGHTGYKPTQAELDELNDPVKLREDGEIFEREIVCVISFGLPPARVVELLDDMNIWDKFMKRWNDQRTGKLLIELEAASDANNSTKSSSGIRILVTPQFSKSCPHGRARGPVPRTAMFTVVAKLSVEDDAHLPREAINYQGFPEHFFHHYNGYTIIPQLRAIVPVHAIVPQFYGYYTPEEARPGQPSYLSPILLLEHCGQPIDPKDLTLCEQEECASFLLRFQRAGYLHESVAPRNFLVQCGPPTEFPLMRQFKRAEPSFRLIDFGRSRKYATAGEKRAEEMETLNMFEGLRGQMAVTFALG